MPRNQEYKTVMAQSELQTFSVTKSARGDFKISINDRDLPEEIVSLCLLLGLCQSEFLPAFIFVRPYYDTPAWSQDGKIVLLQANHRELPTWPTKILQPSTGTHSISATIDHQDLGLTGFTVPQELRPLAFELHPQVEWLRQIGALLISKNYSWMTISMPAGLKETIRRSAATEDTLKIFTELVVLISYSLPNAYAESLWKSLCITLREPIQNDFLPFLAIADLSLLKEHVFKSGLATSRLLHGILSHLISEESPVSSYTPFSSETSSWLYQAPQEFTEAKDLLKVLELRDQIFRQILTGRPADVGVPNIAGSILLDTSVGIQYSKLILHSFTKAFLKNEAFQELPKTDVQIQTSADASELANIVAELIRNNPDEHPLPSSISLQLDRRIALAFALARYKQYDVACNLLQTCYTNLSESRLCSTFEFGVVSAELVKSLNALAKEDAACVHAIAALKKLQASQVPPDRYDSLCLGIALSDAYIGQAAYGNAQELLNSILARSDDRPFESLRCITALRLSKVKRRTGNDNFSELGPTSPIWIAVESLKDASEDVYAETIQELISVRSQMRPRVANSGLQTVQALVDATRRSLHEKSSQPFGGLMAQLADLEVSISVSDIEELHHSVPTDSNRSLPRIQTTTDEFSGLEPSSQADSGDDDNHLPGHETKMDQGTSHRRRRKEISTTPQPSIERDIPFRLTEDMNSRPSSSAFPPELHVISSSKTSIRSGRFKLPSRRVKSPPFIYPENSNLYRGSGLHPGLLVVSMSDPLRNSMDLLSSMGHQKLEETVASTGRKNEYIFTSGGKRFEGYFEVGRVRVVRLSDPANINSELLRDHSVGEWFSSQLDSGISEVYLILSVVIYDGCRVSEQEVIAKGSSLGFSIGRFAGASASVGSERNTSKGRRQLELNDSYVGSLIAERISVKRSRGLRPDIKVHTEDKVRHVFFGPTESR